MTFPWENDPDALVPHAIDARASRAYEEATLEVLRRAMICPSEALVVIDAVERVGERPDTLVVFRYHHRERSVGADPALVAGARCEVAPFWRFAEPEEPSDRGMMHAPAVLAATIGNAFDASELDLADPDTLEVIGAPPRIFPRRYVLPPRDQ